VNFRVRKTSRAPPITHTSNHLQTTLSETQESPDASSDVGKRRELPRTSLQVSPRTRIVQ
jgi:hypothetical protein